MRERRADFVAWDRAAVGLCSSHNHAHRYSRQHVAYEGAAHTLCGARIPWLAVTAGDSRHCGRCVAIARRMALVDGQGFEVVPASNPTQGEEG